LTHDPAAFAILHDADEVPAHLRGAALAIGNFDGVHRGHRAVIAASLALARSRSAPALAVTFEPNPQQFFKPDTPQFLLTDERAKLRLLARTGLAGAVVMTFDAARAATEALDFVNHDLIARLAPAGLVAGFDFHFGKARKGTPDFLKAEGERRGLPVKIVERFDWQDEKVGSRLIRAALVEGDIGHANALLGYPFFVTGTVIHGDRRGRDLGYPTANIAPHAGFGLRHGIYAVRADHRGRRMAGVASFGRRPMFDNGAPLLEVHLFDFDGDLYGQRLDIAFIARIRDEMAFADIPALIAQMAADSAQARAHLAASDAFPDLAPLAD